MAVAAGPAGDAPEIVRVLPAARADVDATTTDGAGALDMSHVGAARHRRNDAGQTTSHDALAELLVSHGATDQALFALRAASAARVAAGGRA